MAADSYEAAIERGNAAGANADWESARDHFRAAASFGPKGEAMEALGQALWWLHDPETIAAREEAYRAYRRDGDKRSAARVATLVALDWLEFRGEGAVAQGWMRRARRMLEDDRNCPEYGWLEAWDGHLGLMVGNDSEYAIAKARGAAEVARKFDLLDLEVLALALEGLALVTSGSVEDGISRLDEGAAAVVAGEMSDAAAIATAICYMMDACDRVRDYDRAAQWCARAQEFASIIHMPELMGFCRPHYAAVLMWRGYWEEAESQLILANAEIMEFRPPMIVEGLVRLAELRWRQGRWDEAGELFDQVKGADLSQLGRAELALSRGHPEEAIDLCQRFLRRIPKHDRIERAFGLELLVRALAASARVDKTEEYVRELAEISEAVRTLPMRAVAALAAGVAADARGDHEAARMQLEDAVDYFARHGAPFESARARVRLGSSLVALGRGSTATAEMKAALEIFERVGADKEKEHVLSLLRGIDPDAARDIDMRDEAGLSRREIEVLRLIAGGLSNQQIADRLVLSVRTVERHISTIYEKLGVSGKAARASATAYAIEHSFVPAAPP